MIDIKLGDEDLPALYQAADKASLDAQSTYYMGLLGYLILLILAAFVAFQWPENTVGAISSAALFLVTLVILVWLKVQKPEDIWYNGRAVAESVRTRAWRWMMKAEPYTGDIGNDQVKKEFLSDLKSILEQNRSLSHCLQWSPSLGDMISNAMKTVRVLAWQERLAIYTIERIDDQSRWYSNKSQFNKRQAKLWFVVSIVMHSTAVLMLLMKISEPTLSLPIVVVATSASAVLTWLQAKKHNELTASYSLAANEIAIIKGEAETISNEDQLIEFVVNSEAAFSREHTQWIARKNV